MAFEKGNTYGSKPKYESPEQMQEKIDAYFEECEGTLLTDHNGDPMLTKWGDPIYLNRRPPTITGLALALGFKTRLSLQHYKAKKAFTDTVLVARSRVEKYWEERLDSRDGAHGAAFNLQRNFPGWQVEAVEENKGPVVTIINDIPRGTTAANTNTDTAVFNPLQKPDEQKQEKKDDGAK